MIDPQTNDLLPFVTLVTVGIGIIVLLCSLLFQREALPVATESSATYTDATASLARMIADGSPFQAAQETEAPAMPAPEAVKASDFAAIVAEAKRQAVAEPQSPVTNTTSERSRITWPLMVDEGAINCDLPTRLQLIESLSFIGGSWSIEILARAYEQELDPNVRGAVFVALRDARSSI